MNKSNYLTDIKLAQRDALSDVVGVDIRILNLRYPPDSRKHVQGQIRVFTMDKDIVISISTYEEGSVKSTRFTTVKTRAELFTKFGKVKVISEILRQVKNFFGNDGKRQVEEVSPLFTLI